MSTTTTTNTGDLAWIDSQLHGIQPQPAHRRTCISDSLQRSSFVPTTDSIIKRHGHHPTRSKVHTVRCKLRYLPIVPAAAEEKGGYRFRIGGCFFSRWFPDVNRQMDVADRFVGFLTGGLQQLTIAIERQSSRMTFTGNFHESGGQEARLLRICQRSATSFPASSGTLTLKTQIDSLRAN